jgi:hypothetical protein
MKTSLALPVAALALACSIARCPADVFTIAGMSFDTANSVQTGAIVEGTINIMDHSSKIFARIEQASKVASGDIVNPYLTFDRSVSLGRLLGRQARWADDRSRYISFPEKGVRGAVPNKDRVTIELTWGKNGLPNRSGPDLVVYEVGTYEPFAVAVRKVGATEFSPYRYNFAFQADPTHGVNSVVFELSAFGVAEGEIIDTIRIRNVFNSEHVAGADKVDAAIGEGRVLYPTDVEYVGGHKLLSTVRGDEFRTDSLDADLVYVAGLHRLIPLAAPAAPKPAGTSSSN